VCRSQQRATPKSKIAIIAKKRLQMWQWFCYDDGEEEDLWSRWYAASDDEHQARHDVVFDFLEARNGNEWREPFSKKINDNLVEVRITGAVQHRLLGFFGSNQRFTFVITCTHKQNIYDPKDAKKTAAKRKKAIEEGATNVRKSKRPKKEAE
jgi:hypothetical protein